MKAKIREIFTSIQGEGPYIGYKQLFVRFSRCNLKCGYCDTDFDIIKSKEYSVEDLIKICYENSDCHSISLTGGEPLLESEFLKEFLPSCPLPVYLETNGTLYKNLEKIIKYIDYVSADIKLESSTNQKTDWAAHDKFFEIAKDKNLFVKVVFGSKITEEEITKISKLCQKYNVELILQPMMIGNEFGLNNACMLQILDAFIKLYPKTRLIPQMHKYINVE